MGETEYLLITILFNFMFLLFVVAIISYVWQYKRKKKEADIKLAFEKSEHQKELLTTQLEIQQATMQEIGLEIHDKVGQKLTLASLYLHSLEFENNTNDGSGMTSDIRILVDNSLADLRQLSKTLTDDSIAKESIILLFQQECDKVNKIKKCILKFDQGVEMLEITYHLKSMMIRIAQEFIQNSLKHANCDLITIKLTEEENYIVLKMKDDGNGFDVNNTEFSGIGLQNMKKRTETIGGKLLLKSTNEGTQLILKLPISL